MASRSTRIIFKNNTPFTLIHLGANLPHGEWVKEPPPIIEPNTDGRWESESSTSGIMTGTEGEASYLLQNTEKILIGESGVKGKCSDEWIEINWDNPYFWDSDTHPIGDDIKPSGSGAVLEPISYDRSCQHQIVAIDRNKDGYVLGFVEVATIFAFVGPLRFLVGMALDDSTDINLEFTLEIRKKGSIKESLLQVYDGRKGLLPLAKMAAKPSLKTLFGF